jgi:hypothetical protein
MMNNWEKDKLTPVTDDEEWQRLWNETLDEHVYAWIRDKATRAALQLRANNVGNSGFTPAVRS